VLSIDVALRIGVETSPGWSIGERGAYDVDMKPFIGVRGCQGLPAIHFLSAEGSAA